MIRFAALLENLLYAPGRNTKIEHLVNWFHTTPMPDLGWGLAALVGEFDSHRAKPALIRQLVESRVDAELFALSYDFVGDMAETVALIWPKENISEKSAHSQPPRLSDIAEDLASTANQSGREATKTLIANWLDTSDATTRWGLLKLITGGLRVGASARLVRLALAKAYDKPVEDIEEIWPLLSPPYHALFDWLNDNAPRPNAEGKAVFRPLMLAHPLKDSDINTISPDDWMVEWKWDGARVQLASGDDGVRLFSRSGDDISSGFPELVKDMQWQGTLDGELLAGRPDNIAPFQMLQQRLNRKKPSSAMLAKTPVFLRLYDILFDGKTDLRHEPIEVRRDRLEATIGTLNSDVMDLSPQLDFTSPQQLDDWRQQCRDGGLIEGLMIKAKGSTYSQGRVKGKWYKWKRDPLTADVVLIYAQRGHGKRSSFFSDYTFAAWMDSNDGRVLVPVGKAYSGFTDEELKKLDAFVRANTVQRFGPVRELAKTLVAEVAFDAISTSSRHKSGVAMRFPRFLRIRWDKLAEDADDLDQLMTWIDR